MNTQQKQAKYHGFQLGIEIAKQLTEEGQPIDINGAIRFARKMADGEETTADPENSGQGFDEATSNYLKGLSMRSLEAQQNHASDVCEGLVSICDSCLDEE